jgi:UDP-N-acetylglucosamine 4,6-dehydratase/5-epimerase
VFNAAALKQIPSYKFFSMEAVKTNVIGMQNAINTAITNKILKLFVKSGQKFYPNYDMGISQGIWK